MSEEINNSIEHIAKCEIYDVIEVNFLKKKFDDLQQKVEEKNKEIDRLNNIINELEKYIGQEWYCFDNESIEFKVARDILNKLKALKEDKNV